jgi:hypothetical protein
MKQSVMRKFRALFDGSDTRCRNDCGKSYSLFSGERQVGANIEEIRADHVMRYELARDDMLREDGIRTTGLGMDLFCGTGYGTAILSGEIESCIWGVDGSPGSNTICRTAFG